MVHGVDDLHNERVWTGARVLQIKLPGSGADEPTPWWALFDTRKEDMDAVVEMVIALYSREPASYRELEKLEPSSAAAPAARADSSGAAAAGGPSR